MLLLLILNIYHTFSSVSYVDFEQINVSEEVEILVDLLPLLLSYFMSDLVSISGLLEMESKFFPYALKLYRPQSSKYLFL